MKKILFTAAAFLFVLGLYAHDGHKGNKYKKREHKERATYHPSNLHGHKTYKQAKRHKRKLFKRKNKIKTKKTYDATCTSPKKLHFYQQAKYR